MKTRAAVAAATTTTMKINADVTDTSPIVNNHENIINVGVIPKQKAGAEPSEHLPTCVYPVCQKVT